MLKRLKEWLFPVKVVYEKVNIPFREEVEVIVEKEVLVPVEVKMAYGGPIDPEYRRLGLMREIQENRTPEVNVVLGCLWNLYQIDSVMKAGLKQDGEKEMVILARDAGHVTLLGCIELLDMIDHEIETLKKEIAERDKNV